MLAGGNLLIAIQDSGRTSNRDKVAQKALSLEYRCDDARARLRKGTLISVHLIIKNDRGGRYELN